MRVNIKTILKDYEGRNIINADVKEDGSIQQIPLTLLNALISAINNPAQLKDAEGNGRTNPLGQPITEIFTAEQKARSYQLSTKMYSTENGEVDFTPEEITYIKERVSKVWNSPVIEGKINEILTVVN